MVPSELFKLLEAVQKMKCETQTLELKSASLGCPEKLYGTLSSFSNQDDGGTIIFGVDETLGFNEVGVYDAQDLQKHVVEQCNQMEPPIRPLFTVVEKCGLIFVSAEIPGIDITERPCFYAGKGRMKGSYVRVGDADELMTEYEVYSYEAFRKKYNDDIRPVPKVSMKALIPELLSDYISRLKAERPHIARIDDSSIYELMSITRDGIPTLSSVLLFGAYPQAFFPQLSIIAFVVPGTEVGDISSAGERFIDNQRIEGTLPQMLEDALRFVKNNTKTSITIDRNTGERIDKNEYPMVAVREALLNALIHRDYSIHTEGMPIQLILFSDRLEIRSPGGLYGRLRVDQLGKVQPDTRNPVIAVAMETLNETENRYSGIPTIYRELRAANMPDPEFINQRGTFTVCFRKVIPHKNKRKNNTEMLLEYCKEFRNRQEIKNFLGISTESYAISKYISPLIDSGIMEMEYPGTPQTPKQRYRVKSVN